MLGGECDSRGRGDMRRIRRKYNGREVTKEELDQLLPPRKDWLDAPAMTANTYSEHDPLISDALGVMKSQVPEMRRTLEKEKVQGVAILDNGQARITSRRGRNHLMKLLTEMRGNNYHDIDAGYGDY